MVCLTLFHSRFLQADAICELHGLYAVCAIHSSAHRQEGVHDCQVSVLDASI